MSIPIDKLARYLKIQKLYRAGKEVPTIRLEGTWIADLGFSIGETVTINSRERLLIIELADSSVKESLIYKDQLQAVKKTLKELAQ
jgi:hypothetical protein